MNRLMAAGSHGGILKSRPLGSKHSPPPLLDAIDPHLAGGNMDDLEVTQGNLDSETMKTLVLHVLRNIWSMDVYFLKYGNERI